MNKNLVTKLLLTIPAIAAITNSVSSQTYRRDYKIDAPIQYQASDPWDRGFNFRNHINHAGFFYNCDGEECKRNSPYLYYLQATEDCRFNARQYIRRQIDEVKWRLQAGGCGDALCYPGCDCEPGVNLNCNVKPDSVNIDYSNLKARLAQQGTVIPSGSVDEGTAPYEVPRQGDPREPTLEFYRPSPGGNDVPQPQPADNGFRRIRLHPSILGGQSKKSVDEVVQMARKSNQEWKRTRMAQSSQIRTPVESDATSTPKSPSLLNKMINRRAQIQPKSKMRTLPTETDNRLFAAPPFETSKDKQESADSKRSRPLLRSALVPIKLNGRR